MSEPRDGASAQPVRVEVIHQRNGVVAGGVAGQRCRRVTTGRVTWVLVLLVEVLSIGYGAELNCQGLLGGSIRWGWCRRWGAGSA